MTSAQTLRYLILALWATVVGGVVLDLALESQLPQPVRDYLDARAESDLTIPEVVGLVVGLVSLWLVITGSVRLYRLRENGRRPFLLGHIVGVLMLPLFGPAIYNAWSFMFYEASTAIGGAIIGWTYLSDVQLELNGPTFPQDQSSRPPPIG